jgi:hypothetical protein
MKRKPIVAEVEEIFIPELENAEMSVKRWTEKDKKIVERYAVEKGIKHRIVAKHLGRSLNSVRQMAMEIRLKRARDGKGGDSDNRT